MDLKIYIKSIALPMGFYSLWFPAQYEKHFSIDLLTMVMSVPQKSLSMEPTMPTMLRCACWSACSFVTWFFSCSSCTGSSSIVQQQTHEIRNLKYAIVLAFYGNKPTDFYFLQRWVRVCVRYGKLGSFEPMTLRWSPWLERSTFWRNLFGTCDNGIRHSDNSYRD